MSDFEFPDIETVTKVRDMVRKISDINASTNTSSIFELSYMLNSISEDQDLTMQLTEDQAHALDLILDLFKGIDADECNVAWDISKAFKKLVTPSDVPRFIAMLKDFQLVQYLPNDDVQELFHDWCSQEGRYRLAKDCIDLIVNTGNNAWVNVYIWLCEHATNPDTDVEKEMDKFKEAIWTRAQDS